MTGPAGRGDHRSVSAARRIGYDLLPGEGFSYILHLRPLEWPIVAGHTLFGFFLAVAEIPSAIARWPIALFGTAVFVVLLNGGTLAINSAFDRDEGDVGYLDAPPPPPPHLFAFGMGLLFLGLLLSILALPRGFTIVYAACFAMSVLYSVPPFRWKAVAGLDLVINAIGFGVLTPLAGWLLSDAVPLLWAMLVIGGFGPLFAALYPLTQIYQMEEDEARGDRTLARMLGVRRALLFALLTAGVAFALIGLGIFLGFGALPAAAVLLPAAVWLGLLLRWLRRYPTMSSVDHKRGMYNALRAWALTNVVILLSVFLLPQLI